MKTKEQIDLDKILQKAVNACCGELDEYFPGGECGGIDSNLAYAIEKNIRKELGLRKLVVNGKIKEESLC
jgi:hypothetical protein